MGTVKPAVLLWCHKLWCSEKFQMVGGHNFYSFVGVLFFRQNDFKAD